MTLPELVLWDALRARHFNGLRFRRQHPIGPYILDFYCPAASICIEVDGVGHLHEVGARHDKMRDTWLRQRGVRVLRFTADEILGDESRAAALDAILTAARTGEGSSPVKRGRGTMRSMVEGALR